MAAEDTISLPNTLQLYYPIESISTSEGWLKIKGTAACNLDVFQFKTII